ncbi:Flavohemoprotein [Usitatibacter rugosus]|uniref:Flavohemoprotein n=1 Tax=Usitatibacter rugosus TaxID=2732067 RepID=A0A6M4GR84_9PROT|nr:globin family protein [Usitatibacter rugosus]QJR09859.1 Flavohemoprotein [Usitatibacter rugosus]
MTPQQIALVQDSWKKIVPIRDMAALLFYARLFELDPSLRPHFRKPLDQQGRKLMGMLGTAVGCLGRMGEITATAGDLGRRHAAYGVKDEHYDSVAEAFLWTLEQALDTDFTPELREAWTVAYTTLANVMKDAANDPAFSQAVA